MNVKVHKNCQNTGKIMKILCIIIIIFIFSDCRKEFSLVLLQVTNYIFSP